MKKLRLCISLLVLMPIAACSTIRHEQVEYKTAELPSTTTTDAVAVDGFESVQQQEYPTLYYYSPGIRRMKDSSY